MRTCAESIRELTRAARWPSQHGRADVHHHLPQRQGRHRLGVLRSLGRLEGEVGAVKADVREIKETLAPRLRAVEESRSRIRGGLKVLAHLFPPDRAGPTGGPPLAVNHPSMSICPSG